MGHIIKNTTLALLLLRAAENEPNVITLSCDGMLTATYGANKPKAPQPLQKTGLVVNLDEQTVFFWAMSSPLKLSTRPASTSAERGPSSMVSASPSGATLIEQPVAWTQHW